MSGLDAFCTWLAATAPSQWLQNVEWIVPAVQTVHILCVAAVVASALMIELQMLRVGGRGAEVAAMARRFGPFVWWPLPVLAASGSVLIVAEPARSLENPVFVLKMALLLLVVGATVAGIRPLRTDPGYWERSAGRRAGARVLGAITLALWVGIVFAGRWIAYVRAA